MQDSGGMIFCHTGHHQLGDMITNPGNFKTDEKDVRKRVAVNSAKKHEVLTRTWKHGGVSG